MRHRKNVMRTDQWLCRRRHIADRLGVKSFQGGYHRTEGSNFLLKRADLLPVDGLGDVDAVGCHPAVIFEAVGR